MKATSFAPPMGAADSSAGERNEAKEEGTGHPGCVGGVPTQTTHQRGHSATDAERLKLGVLARALQRGQRGFDFPACVFKLFRQFQRRAE